MSPSNFLSEQHRRSLEIDSAIAGDVIERRGYRTITNMVELIRLGFADYQARVPGLLIPIWGPAGTEPVSYQYRPDNPRMKDGKPIKYESLPKTPTRLDVPPGARDNLTDPRVTLWITEGSKKADAAISKGLACVALTGVWNFKVKNAAGGSVVLGDFEHIHLKGREVVICYDSDVMDKRSVRQAIDRLRDLLLSRGAVVKFSILVGEPGEKVGLDDFFASGGTVEQLASTVRDTLPGQKATTLADVEAEEVNWLWFPYLPLAESTLLAGDGGVGKSYVAMAIAAAITRGWALPGCEPTQPRDVLYVTDEDDTRKTLKPRATKLRMDQSRFHVIDRSDVEDDEWYELVLNEAIRLRATLIVLDPFQSFMGAGTDMNKTSDVRPFMKRVRLLASDTGATVLIITHINKMTGGKAQYRVNGSVDLVNASRSSLMAGFVDADGEEMCVLGHAKSNYSARGPSLRYEVSESGVEWLGIVLATVDDISTGQRKVTKVDEAAEFLGAELAPGARFQTDIEESAKGQGITSASLRRAKKALGIISRKGGGGWEWRLPVQDDQDAPVKEDEHLEVAQVQNLPTEPPAAVPIEHLESQPKLPSAVELVQTPGGQGLTV